MTVKGTTIPQNLSLYQRGARGEYAGYYAFNGHIDVPANQDYVLQIFAPCKFSVQFGVFKLSAGTLTANFQIGPTVGALTSITAFSAIAVTNVIQEVDYVSTNGTNIGVIGTVFVLTVTNIAAAANFDFSMIYKRE